MKVAFVIFDRMTSLDFISTYDPVGRLSTMGYMDDLSCSVCSRESPVADDRGLQYLADQVGQPLKGFDMIVVPGGIGTRDLQVDDSFLDWLRTAADSPIKASVCTGSLLLGAAGFLTGHVATSHRSAMEQLAKFCRETSRDRVVDDGDVITARGVTAGIDLGLHLVARIAGANVRREIASQMDYPYFDARQ